MFFLSFAERNKILVNQIKLKHRHTDTFNETFERFV